MSYPREILGNYSMQEEAGDSLSRPLLLSREDHDEAAGDVTSHLLHLGPPEVGGQRSHPRTCSLKTVTHEAGSRACRDFHESLKEDVLRLREEVTTL